MDIIETLFPTKKIKEPVFLKESSALEEQITYLNTIKDSVNAEDRAEIVQEIRLLNYGLTGEKNIAFELKHSHMPIIVLHDINLQKDGLTAQIDYVIIARKMTYIVECKNLYGNITVTADGVFERTIPAGSGRYIKEGIYSPVTQNKRHMDLIKQMKPKLAQRYFDSFHKSVIVLANPRTILKCGKAPKAISDQIIRCDQLISYIADMEKRCRELSSGDQQMKKRAEFYIHNHVELDWKDKYRKYLREQEKNTAAAAQEADTDTGEALSLALRKFRSDKSKESRIKPYMIFTNAELELLVARRPSSVEQLEQIDGFGQYKVGNFGEEIVEIINRF